MSMESQGHHRGGMGSAWAAVGAVLAMSIAGCGDGAGGSAAGTTETTRQQPLSRAELIAKADAICLSGQKAFRAVTKKAYPTPNQVSVPNPTERLPNVPYAEDVVDVAKRVVGQLKTLTPPPRMREAYEAYVRAEEEVERLAIEALDASIDDDGGAYYKARATRDAGALERANLAEAIGLKRCSPNPFFH